MYKKNPRKVYSFILKNWQWVFYEAPSPNEVVGDKLYMHILKKPKGDNDSISIKVHNNAFPADQLPVDENSCHRCNCTHHKVLCERVSYYRKIKCLLADDFCSGKISFFKCDQEACPITI